MWFILVVFAVSKASYLACTVIGMIENQ